MTISSTSPEPGKTPGIGNLPVSRDAGWLIGALVLAVVIWSYTATATSFWQDEYFSFNTAMRPIGETVRQTLHFELQPPLYFLTLHFWLKLGSTALFGRLLSLLFSLGTIRVLTALGGQLSVRRPWLHLGVLGAVTPAMVWAAAQSRTYSLAILLVSITLLQFTRIWVLQRPVKRLDYLWYVLSAYGALLTNYYTGFVLAGQFLAALILSHRRRGLLASYAVLTLAFIPWAPTVLMQLSTHPTYYGPDPLTFARPNLIQTLGHLAVWLWHTVAQAVYWGPVVTRPVVAVALILGLAAVLVARRKAGPLGRVEWALVVTAVVPAAVLLGLRAWHLAYVGVRHWAVAVPGILVLVVTLIDRIDRAGVRRLLAAGFTASLLLGLVSTMRNLNPFDWRSAAQLIRERMEPGEPVAVFPSHGVGPTEYYLADRAVVHGLPSHCPLVSDLPIASPSQLSEAMERVTMASATFWLVRGDVEDFMGPQFLDSYLAGKTIMDRHRFAGLTVYHIEGPSH